MVTRLKWMIDIVADYLCQHFNRNFMQSNANKHNNNPWVTWLLTMIKCLAIVKHHATSALALFARKNTLSLRICKLGQKKQSFAIRLRIKFWKCAYDSSKVLYSCRKKLSYCICYADLMMAGAKKSTVSTINWKKNKNIQQLKKSANYRCKFSRQAGARSSLIFAVKQHSIQNKHVFLHFLLCAFRFLLISEITVHW